MLANLQRYIHTALTTTIRLFLHTLPRKAMSATTKPYRSSISRSRKPPSFLDDLAFATVATPEERRKLREKRRERSKRSGEGSRASSSEGRKHRRHEQARDSLDKVEEVEFVEDISAAGEAQRRYKERRGGFSRERQDMANMEGVSSDGEAEARKKPFASRLGGLFGKKGEPSGTRRSEDSSDPWDTTRETPSGSSYSFSKDEDFDTFSDALKKLSIKEDRDRGSRTEGSWCRDAPRCTSSNGRYSSESSRPTTPASNGDSLPGGWPSSSGRSQTESWRPPFREKARPIEEMFRDGMTGRQARRRVPRSRDASRSRERGPRPSPLLPIFPNPDTIAPRRPKKVSAGTRHLRPGAPLTEENVAQHTIAGGGQKGFGAKSKGWEGCVPGGESEGSEGSLWCDGAAGEVEAWDSLSNKDYRY